MSTTLFRAGRVLLALIFVLSALGKLADWSGTAAYMAAKSMPLVPLFLAAAIVLELGGGLAVLTGRGARLGAVALVVFLVPTTLIFHNFWAAAGIERQNQLAHFMKNVAIVGGLLLVAASDRE